MMSFIRSLSLRAKIALSVSTVILLALIIASQVTASLLARQMERDSLEELGAKTRQIVDNLELLDQVLRRSAATLAAGLEAYFPEAFVLSGERGADGIPLLHSGAQSVNGEAARLQLFKAKTGADASLLVRSGADFVRVATTLKSAKGEAALGSVLERGAPAYAALIAGRSYEGALLVLDRAFMTKYSPLKDAAGKVIGASVVGFDTTAEIERLKAGLRQQKIGGGGYFSIFDVAAGAAILPPPNEGRDAAPTPSGGRQSLLDALRASAQGTLRMVPAEGQGEQVHVFARAPSWQWAVVATAPAHELVGSGNLLRRIMLLTALATGLVLCLLVYTSVDRFVTRPLRGLLGFANRIARGDLSARDGSSYAADDETGALLKAFNTMRDRLLHVVASVRGGADSVTSAANQIAGSSRELSMRTEAQANSSAQVVATLEELTATVKQTAANAGNADAIANQAAAAAVQGNTHVSTMVETMTEIQRSSTRITDVVGVIDSIAFQTNILALNAAVEAARAGEHGRGFSVVASEVRALAQRAGQSAREIKQLVAAAADSTGNGANRVSEASRAIGEILVAIEQVAALVREISVAALQQSRALEQVNQTVTQMDYVTQQNATIVTQYAAAAQQLAQHAAQLTRSVAVFKLADGAAELVQVESAPAQPIPARSRSMLPKQ